MGIACGATCGAILRCGLESALRDAILRCALRRCHLAVRLAGCHLAARLAAALSCGAPCGDAILRCILWLPSCAASCGGAISRCGRPPGASRRIGRRLAGGQRSAMRNAALPSWARPQERAIIRPKRGGQFKAVSPLVINPQAAQPVTVFIPGMHEGKPPPPSGAGGFTGLSREFLRQPSSTGRRLKIVARRGVRGWVLGRCRCQRSVVAFLAIFSTSG
jgi:hypothetical protein